MLEKFRKQSTSSGAINRQLGFGSPNEIRSDGE